MFFKKKRKEQHLDHLGKFSGHNLYAYKSVDSMPKIREMEMRKGYHQMELGVTIRDLNSFIKFMEQELNKGSIVNASRLLTEFKYMVENYCSERVLLYVAGSCILVDDESEFKIDAKYYEIKERLLESKEVQSFFLSTSINLLSQLQGSLNISEVENSLKRVERMDRELSFLNAISTDIRKNIWRA